MVKIKLTKNELKKQKDALKRYNQYLPTLMLKKQQLQAEVTKVQHAIEELEVEVSAFEYGLNEWVAVFNEPSDIEKLVIIEQIGTRSGNIAGVEVPVFEEVRFGTPDYDPLQVPLWVIDGLATARRMIGYKIRLLILHQQQDLLQEELRITTQRVNLFEKVKIPQARESIRKISIYLGDMQTAAVVTGKIAKSKINRKLAEQVRQ